MYSRLLRSLYISGARRLSVESEFQDSVTRSFEERINYLSELLQIDADEAAKILVKKRHMFLKDREKITRVAQLCSEFKISTSNIISQPNILTLNPGVLEQRYHIMKELGFLKITSNELTSYPRLIKRTPNILTGMKLLAKDAKPLCNMLSVLGNPDLQAECEQYVLSNHDISRLSIDRIRSLGYQAFLVVKCGLSKDDAIRTIDTYTTLSSRSLSFSNQCVEIYERDFELSMDKIRRNGFLFANNPNHVRGIYSLSQTSMKEINLKALVHMFPKILSGRPENLTACHECCKKFGITLEQISKLGNIYTLSIETLLERITTLLSIPELEIFRHCPRFVSLIFYFPKVLERLKYLKAINYSYISIDILISHDQIFKRVIDIGNERTMGLEIITLIANQLDIPKLQVKDALDRHHGFHNVSALSIKTTLDYLMSGPFSKQQVVNGLQALLYSIEMLEEELAGLKEREELQPFDKWANHEGLLQLVVYYIEKRTEFRGTANLAYDKPLADPSDLPTMPMRPKKFRGYQKKKGVLTKVVKK